MKTAIMTDTNSGITKSSGLSNSCSAGRPGYLDVLSFSLSKNISGNYNSARLAAEELADKSIN